LILDTKELTRGNNYTIGCELHNDIVFVEKKTTAMAKVNLIGLHNRSTCLTFGIFTTIPKPTEFTHNSLVLRLIFFLTT